MRPERIRIPTHFDNELVCPGLELLLQAIRTAVEQNAPDLHRVRTCLENLLEFLSSLEGRTNANCSAADSFFLLDEYWTKGWDHLPESHADVLGYIAGGLHDTVSAPEIARNFHATPEQILTRLRDIPELT